MIARTSRVLPLLESRKQHAFRHSRQRVRGFVAGRGAGKSRIGAIDCALRAKDGWPCMGVSPSKTVIADTTYPTFRDVCEQLDIWVKGRQHPSYQAWFRTQDGGIADITFRSGDDPEKLRGPSKALLWLDEASIMAEEVFKIGLPVLRHKGIMGPCTLTFTPKGRRHWTFGLFYDEIDEDDPNVQFGTTEDGELYGLVMDPATGKVTRREVEEIDGRPYFRKPNSSLTHAHTLENPFLPPDFYDTISPYYSTALAAQELGGKFVELLGMLFLRSYFIGKMVDDVPKDAQRVRYWDRAATHEGGNYSCGVLMAMTELAWYVEDVRRGQWSAYERNQMMEETAREDARKYGNNVLIYTEQEGGSAGKEISQQAIMQLAGFPVFADLVTGRRTRTKDKVVLPGEAKIVRARPLVAQCEAGNVFIRRAKWTEDFLEELCLAEGTLVETMRGCVPIQHVRVGDRARTRSGWRVVEVSQITNRKACVCQINMTNGRTLTATPNHPIWVHCRGFTRVDCLSPGDALLRSMTATDSTSTRTPENATIPGSSAGSTWSSIDISGCVSEGRFPAGTMYTTLTATQRTTPSTILSACLRGITSSTISQTGMSVDQSPEIASALSVGRSTYRRRAGDPRRALTPAGIPFSTDSATNTSIAFAVSRAARKSIPHTPSSGFVASAARPKLSNKNESLLHETVSGAGSSFSPKAASAAFAADVAVSSILILRERRPVYNLQVQGTPEFIANGVLVHNCAFPEYAFDDQVDASSGAFNRLALMRTHGHAATTMRSIGAWQENSFGVNVVKTVRDRTLQGGRS